jgi:hypothetical protein
MAKRGVRRKPASRKTKGSIQVPLHSVVHFVRMLHDEGHADKFVEEAKKAKAVMGMDSGSVNFVRDYLNKNQLHKAMVDKVVDPCPNDPFECHFRE